MPDGENTLVGVLDQLAALGTERDRDELRDASGAEAAEKERALSAREARLRHVMGTLDRAAAGDPKP